MYHRIPVLVSVFTIILPVGVLMFVAVPVFLLVTAQLVPDTKQAPLSILTRNCEVAMGLVRYNPNFKPSHVSIFFIKMKPNDFFFFRCIGGAAYRKQKTEYNDIFIFMWIIVLHDQNLIV